MKRINYDELIWFILLVILTFLMFFLIKSDEIQNFIDGRMLIFFKFSVKLSKDFTFEMNDTRVHSVLPAV